MFKRMIAAILVAAMMVSELPTAALAEMLEESVVTEEAIPETASPVTEAVEEESSTGATVQTTGATEGTTEETDASETTEEPEATSTPETEPSETTEGETTALAEETDGDAALEETESIGEAVVDNLSWNFDEETCVLSIWGDGEMLDASAWLDYGWQVETIVIEEGVTSICEGAFQLFSSLNLVLLPNSLESIGAYAFEECTVLTEIFIPAGVTQIGNGAFSGCSELSSVQIFGYDVTIAEDAFEGVTADVFYPYDAQWSDYGGYGGTLNWNGYSRILGTGLYNTSRWVLDGGGMLQILGTGTLESQTSAAGYPWYAYADRVFRVSVSGVENVPQYAFAGYNNLSTAYFYQINSVGAGSFSGCSGLQKIYFNSLMEIASDAFTGVTAAVSYSEEDGWTEDRMLDYGGDLDWAATYEGHYGDNIYWSLTGNNLTVNGIIEGAVMESQSSAEGYPWYAHKDRIQTILIVQTSVGDYAFDGYTDLETVEIYNSAAIGACTFRGCTALTDITLDSEPPVIAEDAFTGVTAQVHYNSYYAWFSDHFQNYGGNLTWGEIVYEDPELASGTHGDNASWSLSTYGTLTITGEGEMENQTSAEGYGWYDYRDQIQDVIISGLTNVGDYAFAGYPILNRLEMQESVTKVGSHILDGCTAVNYVTFNCMPPESIAEDALAGLSNAGLLYPYRYEEQWQSAIESFYGGTDLWWSMYTVSIAHGAVSGGHWNIQENGYMYFSPNGQGGTFAIGDMEAGAAPWSAYADIITNVSFEGVTSIGANAFYGMEALAGVEFPETLTTIGDQAFAGCTALNTIRFQGTVNTIGENAFRDVTAYAYYYTAWDSAMLQNYGGTLNWEQSVKWVAGGDISGSDMTATINWNLFSDGSLSLYAENETPMSAAGSAAEDYPWHSYADQITTISVSNISSISDYAFAGCTGLTSFLFDYRITALGNYIFDGCTNLKELTFHGSAPEFSENTFYGVTATVVSYPTGDESWTADKLQDYGGTINWGGETGGEDTETIGGTCGENLTWKLTEDGTLTISGTGEMNDYDNYMLQTEWYWDAENVKRIVIEEGVTSVGSYAFYGSFGNVTEISLPDSLISIGDHAFEDCKAVTELTFGSNLEYIGSYAFISSGLTGTLTLPDSLTTIDSYAFRGSTGLTAVELGSGLETIGAYAFGGCSNLTSITMTGDAPTISDTALQWTTTTIYYPVGNTTWTDDVKQNYGGTITWTAVGELTGSCGENLTWTLGANGTLTISGTGAMEDYEKGWAPWSEYQDTITALVLEEGITNIGEAAFYGCNGLTSVECPDSLLTIEESAFQNCSMLETVTFNQGLERIQDASFSGCEKLTSLEFPDSLTYIGRSAFIGCSGLTGDLVIPGNASVGVQAFEGCGGFNGTLTILGGGEKYIDVAAFRGCHGFTGLVLGSGITEIGDYAFYNCTGLTGAVVIPASVTSIGSDVFHLSSGITHVRFESVDCPVIENDSLGTMSGLESIYVPGENYASYEALLAALPYTVEIQTDWEYFPVEYLMVENVYSRTAVLYWDAHRSGEAAGYTIFRDGIEIGKTTEYTYTDRGLEPDTAYTYTVQAYFEDGRVTTESDSVSVQTVLPEISSLSGYVEYANVKKFADVCNTIQVTILDKGNLGALGNQKHTVGLYYSNGGDETLIGWAECADPRSIGDTSNYALQWDVSILSDGEYTLRAVLTDVDGTTAEWTETVQVDNTAPARLLQLAVTGSEQYIDLSWAQAQEYDSIGYNIYRSVGSQDNFQLLAEIDSRETLTYQDTTADETEICYYYVVAVDIFGREASGYDIVGGSRIADTVKPRVVQLLPTSGTYLTGTAVFTVKAEDNVAVTGTKVEYSADQEATWTELTAEDKKYTLDTTAIAADKITVRAYAYDAAGNESDAFSQTYAIDNQGPEQVTGLSHVSTSVTLTLSWQNVADQDIGGFQVEQKQADGTWKVIAGNVTALGHNLRGLMPDTAYTFRVTAYDIFGNMGAVSEEYTAVTAADTTAPVTAQLLPASGSFSKQIALSATVEDDYSVASAVLEYSLDNLSWTQISAESYTGIAAVRKISAELDLTDIPEGLLYVRAVTTDLAGNTTTETSFVQHMVDKTAPAAPAGVTATGYSGYVEVRWSGAADVKSYQIYRAETEDGEFVLMAEGHTSLNYFDRTVEDGAVYYYQVAAVDAAGNVSVCCETVSAQASEDNEAPVILSVAPVSGDTLGRSYAQVSVLVKDNSSLNSILVEYSHDGVAYVTLTEQQDINAYGTTVSGTIPIAEFEHGDTVHLRITASDYAGNVCDAEQAVYTIDAQAPAISAVNAQYSEETVIVSWTGGAEADLAGYRIYRRDSSGIANLIGQVAAAEGQTDYTWTDGNLPVSGGTFLYLVEAVDAVGNTAAGSSSSGEIPGQEVVPGVVVPARTGPTALLSCDSVMTMGVECIIDGSGSTDDGQIISYSYDFGDGTTATGKSPIHTYTEEGTYIISLTVTDDDAQTHTVSKRVKVKAPNLVGNVQVRIIDEKGAPVPDAPVYFDLGEESQVIRGTDASGYASFTAEVGRHTVGCVILNNQWLPVKRDLIVNAGETTSVSMTLINKPIVEGTFEIKPMTLEEIEAAGIDLTDPENQYYVEVLLHLEYDNVEIDETIPGSALGGGGGGIIFDPTGKYKPKKKDDDEPDPIIITPDDPNPDDDDIRGWSIELIDKSKDPKLMILDIPIGVQSLKEMFDVRLHILNNASSEFSMLDNVITLDTPSGLSVVTDAYMKSQKTANVAEIKGQTQETIEWVVRGDQPGEYTLGADYSGILSQFNEPLTARFEAKEPIQVYGMSGMSLVIEVAEELENGTLYYNVILENNGKVDIYKPVIKTDDILIEMQLYDAVGHLTAEGTDESGSGINMEAIEALLGDMAKESSFQTISSLPDVLAVGNKLIMYYMSIDKTEYTHCVMELKEKSYDIANTYGLEDIYIFEKPLDYFRQSMNTQVNSQEKADLTFTTNKDAYNQLIKNNNYVYWIMANDKKDEFDLSNNADEIMWDTLKGDLIKAATDNEDTEQVKAMIVDLLSMTAESVDDVKYTKQLNFLKAVREVVDGMSLSDILGDYAESFKKALDSAYEELKDRGSLYKTGYSYALEDLIYEHWKTWMEDGELEILDKVSSFVKLQKILADKDSEKVWKKIGLSIKAIQKLQELTENVLLDIEWILEAQAKEDAMLVCLNAMINNFTLSTHLAYEDSADVKKCLIDMKEMLETEGIAYAIISNLVDLIVDIGIEKLVGKGTDVVMEMVGGGGDPLTYFIIKTVNLTAAGIDMLTNLSEQQDMADHIRFAAMLSDSARSAVINARNVYKNNKTPENAARYMQLLKLLINLRALGESQVALYGKSFETDFTVGNLPLLKVVRAKTDAKKATSWYQWRDIVEDRISEMRVRLLRNPLSVEITGRERPTVSFDYSCGQTLQSFDDTFEYSLDKGENWTPCDGGPIPVEAPEISVELWVRKIDSSNTDLKETGCVTIYGPLSVDAAEMEVLKTPEGYRIEGLDPDKTYQVTFSASPMDYSYDTVLETTLPQSSYSYSLNTSDVYNYVYIRATADQNGYMSEIAQLGIVSTVNLNVFVTGEGLVMDHETVWEYGSQVSLTAVPAENRIFDGWYRSGAKVSSSLTYTFHIYASMYLEARFVTLDDIDLPGASGDVDPITGTGSATTEDGTTVTVTGAPETAAKLVVETDTDEETANMITTALAEIGNPVQVYDIYFVDLENVREEADGVTITLDYSGDAEDLILCGISGDGVASVLPGNIEDGQITFTGDGSAHYVLVQLPDRYIGLQTDVYELLPGQKANLSAQFLPGNPTGTKIQWSLAEGDDMYATLKVNGDSAVLTALSATGSRSVVVTASAADGSFPSTSVEILVVPYVYQLTIHTEDADVTGEKIKFDVNRETMLELTAVVAPEDATQEVNWSSSNEEIAEVTEGLVSFTGETGTVKITAASNDGSKKSASVTIQVVALTQDVEMAEGSVSGLVGGETATFEAIDAVTRKTLTKTELTWSLDEAYASYASITAAGKLTTREVAEQTVITITGRVVGNEEEGVVEHKVTIYPKATYVELWQENAVVNGGTILVDTAQATENDLPVVELEALVYPGDAMENVTWKIQPTSIAEVDQNGIVTVKWDANKQACKTGTVTVTATAADGSKAAASVKLNFGVFVKEINIEAPELELRSGQKMTLSAETVPANPTKTGVTWSLAGEEDSNYATITAAGRLTAKTVYDEHTVTVVATAKDGSGVTAEIPVLIRPKTDGILTLYSGEKNVTKSIVSVDLNETAQITLSAYTLGDYLTEDVTWKSSSGTVASLEDHGDGTATVTMLRSGGTSITATAEDGRTATVTLKGIRLTSNITVTSKTGEMTVASGKSLTLKAAVEPTNATTKTVLWSVAEADAAYATISSSGKLTAAKELLEARTITVLAKAKDGGAETAVQVYLTPLASGVILFRDSGEAVSNTILVHNMADSDTLQLTAKVYPLNQASDSVTWKSSNKKIADIDEDGMITCLKAGTVTITATANDGSKEKATFKLKVEKWMTELTLPDTAVIAGGKTLTMTKLKDYFVDPDASNKTLIWTMEGEGAAFATLSSKGVLKTKKVTEPKTLTVTATAADDGGTSAQCEVTIYPATTKVQVLNNGEIVTGTLTLTEGESLDLDGTSLPVSAADAYTWKSSSVKYAEVDEDGIVTAIKSGKTVSISCVAADGSGKSAVVKIKIIAAE